LFILAGGPVIEATHGRLAFTAPLTGITAAVVGVILNLAIWFALHTLFHTMGHVQNYGFSFDAPVFTSVDWWALALSAAANIAIFRFKTGMIQTLAASSALGVGLYFAGVMS